MTDYALWTLGWLDGLVEKSSFPFHRSDYLCRESVNAAITHLFCRKCRIYVFFCRKCRDYALFGVEFYAEFWQKFSEIRRILAENLRKKLGGGASAPLCKTDQTRTQNQAGTDSTRWNYQNYFRERIPISGWLFSAPTRQECTCSIGLAVVVEDQSLPTTAVSGCWTLPSTVAEAASTPAVPVGGTKALLGLLSFQIPATLTDECSPPNK